MTLPAIARPERESPISLAPPLRRAEWAGPDGRTLLTLALVGAVPLLVAIAAIGTWPVGVFQDDGIYAILARSLADGEGYRYLNLPGAPSATHYPPAYPIFLALLWKLSPRFPANVALFTFSSAVFLAGASLGAYWFGRSRLGLPRIAAVITAWATTACVPALIFGVFLMSEPMFMALLVPVLFTAERAADTGRPRNAVVAGLAAGALAMVRTLGQFMVPALLVVLLLRRRWRAAAFMMAGAAIFLVPWQLWVSAHAAEIPPVLVGKYGAYMPWLTEAVRSDGLGFLAQVIFKNARALEGTIWAMFAGRAPDGAPPPIIVRAILSLAVSAFLALGVTRVWRRAPVTLLFVGSYLLCVIAWPFEPTRFVWVLLPLIGLVAAAGVVTLIEWRAPAGLAWAVRIAGIAMVAVLSSGYAIYNVRGVREEWWNSVPKQNAGRATPLVAWALSSSQPGDLLATDDDALVHLYTGRRTIPIGTFTPQEYLTAQTYVFASERLVELIDRFRPRYVLCSTSYGVMAARALVAGAHPRLRLVRVLSRGVVFETIAP